MGLFCEVCNITVSSDAVMKDHVKGKKHLRLADIQIRQKQQAERSVFVRGFSYGTKDVTLKNFFSKYGPLDNVFVDRERGSYAIVEFRSRDSVAKLLQSGHQCYLGNRKLTIKPREVKTYVPKKKEVTQDTAETTDIEPPSYDLEAVLSDLVLLKTVEEQMTELREKVRLTAEDTQKRHQICDHLQELARPIFPNCEVHQFGSSVNGFGVKGCDMDIFLDLNLDLPLDEAMCKAPADIPYIKDIKSLRIENGRISHESLQKAPWRDKIKLVGRMLTGTELFGKDVLTIPSARCPVVKVTHQQSAIKCDISINNRMALRNTMLLQLLGYEPRLGPLTYTVRLWAKSKDLTGQGPRLTSYALTLLVVFYLQQTDPPVLPSVKTLAELTSCEQRVSLDQWECSFPAVLPPTENTSSIDKLLRGFYDFYAEFDFSGKVIDLRHGTAHDIGDFKEKALANALVESYKFGPMCVQDPFVLDHNTTLNVNVKVRSQLTAEFQEAAAKYADSRFTNTSGVWGVPFLLSEEKVRKSDRIEEETCGKLALNQMSYKFEVIYNPLRISAKVLKELPQDERKKLWAQRITNVYKRLLMEALLFECEEVKNEGKCQSKNDSSDSHDMENGNNSASSCEKGDIRDISKHQDITENTENCIGLLVTEHTSTKRSLSHESAMVASESKKCRSDSKDDSQIECHKTDQATHENSNTQMPAAGSATDTENSHARNEKVLLHSRVQTFYRMWTGRKKAKSKVKVEHGCLDLVDLEVKVTEELKQIEQLKSKEVVLSFETAVVENGGQNALVFYLHPLTGVKEFSCFYAFFRAYFIRIADKQIC